jgi:hypothetical protein
LDVKNDSLFVLYFEVLDTVVGEAPLLKEVKNRFCSAKSCLKEDGFLNVQYGWDGDGYEF